MELIIIGQILGFIATFLTFLSYQANEKKKLLLIQSAGTLSTCLSYLFLGADSGFLLNVVCLARNGAFYVQKKRNLLSYIVTGVFVVAMIGLGIYSWQGPLSLLITVALAVNTVMLSLGNAQWLRISILVTSTMVLIYNCCFFSFGGVLNESVAIISSAIGIIRYQKMKGKNNS